MHPAQITLIQTSFARLAPQAPQVAALFYQQLFARDAALQALFRGDMAQQGERLMAMIGAAVGLLGRPAALDQALTTLGARHTGYGVQPAHYDTVGAALLDTLALGLGPDFTPALRDAWAALYAHISRTMQAGAVRAETIETPPLAA